MNSGCTGVYPLTSHTHRLGDGQGWQVGAPVPPYKRRPGSGAPWHSQKWPQPLQEVIGRDQSRGYLPPQLAGLAVWDPSPVTDWLLRGHNPPMVAPVAHAGRCEKKPQKCGLLEEAARKFKPALQHLYRWCASAGVLVLLSKD